MDFPALGVQKYLQKAIWFEIHRHRKFFSVSAECDLAETANAPAPSLQASPYISDTKLQYFFFFHIAVQCSQKVHPAGRVL